MTYLVTPSWSHKTRLPGRKPGITHGTRSGYNQGCGCEARRKASSEKSDSGENAGL